MSEELPVEFNEVEPAEVPVKLDAKAQRKKERLELLATYPELGSKVLKIKAKDLAAIGRQIELVGTKKVGLGSLAVSNEAAVENMMKCAEYVKMLEAKGFDGCPDAIIAILQLQKQLGDQLIEVAQTYLDADKQIGNGKAEKPASLVFPSGQSMVIAVNSKPKEKEEPIDKQLTE